MQTSCESCDLYCEWDDPWPGCLVRAVERRRTMNELLIGVIKEAIQREYERIERARAEIVKLKEELADLNYEEPRED